MRRWSTWILAAAVLVGLSTPASAGMDPAAAAERMKALGIIRGVDASGDLALGLPLTRAQMVTLLVRAFGQEENAQLLTGARSGFRDVPSDHWAAGYIAVAKTMAAKQGLSLGTGTDTFDPERPMTAAEVLAFVMKFLGIPPAAGKTWPADYIQGAREAGLLGEEDATALMASANAPATRGLAFALADLAFATYTLPNGKTPYQQYLDNTPPMLVVGTYPAVTEADSARVGGVAPDAVSVTVGGEGVAMGPGGRWSAHVALARGANTIVITAVDAAGNTTSRTISIHRVTPRPPAPSLEIAEMDPGICFVGVGIAAVTPTVTGGQPPYTFEYDGLPPGLTYDASTGTITGTPSLAGDYLVHVVVRDQAGNTAETLFTWSIK